MTAPIAANVPSTPATAAGGAEGGSLESLMAQRFMMNFQQGQQAMSKSMTKMTDQIKASMQDDEE